MIGLERMKVFQVFPNSRNPWFISYRVVTSAVCFILIRFLKAPSYGKSYSYPRNRRGRVERWQVKYAWAWCVCACFGFILTACRQPCHRRSNHQDSMRILVYNNRVTRFLGGFTSHLFLESLGYVCVALKRIWPRVVIFRPGFSVL